MTAEKKGSEKERKKMKQVREKSLNLKTLRRRMRMFHFLNQKSCHSVTRSDEEKKNSFGQKLVINSHAAAVSMHNNFCKKVFWHLLQEACIPAPFKFLDFHYESCFRPVLPTQID